jgi:hypothetical protein
MQGEDAVLGTPSVDPLFLLPWQSISTFYWIYASGAAIYRTDGSSHEDISRLTGGAYNGGSFPHWQGGVFNGIPFMNNDSGSDVPQAWDGANMENMTGWPASTYCKVIRAFKNYLIAMNMNEGGTAYPTKVRWSAEADPGTLPSTWVAAATNNAGSYPLSESSDEILDGLALGDVFFVYKERSTHLMRLVGGAFVFHTNQAFRTYGILSTGCAVEFDKKHFVVTQGDVIVHDGAQVDSVIDQLNRDYLFTQIDASYKDEVQVVYNQQKSEIWIAYPTAGSSGRLTEAAVWNTTTSVWTLRQLNNVAYLAAGVLTETTGTTYIISALTMPISEMLFPIGATASQSNARLVVLAGLPGSGKAFLQMDSTEDFNGVAFDAVLERTGLAISGQDRRKELTVDPTSLKYIREFYPRITALKGTTLQFRFGSQMRFEDDIDWLEWESFTVGTDRKLNLDMSFCYFAMQVKADESAAIEFDGYDMDLEIIGRY